eukprot:gene9173-10764_t
MSKLLFVCLILAVAISAQDTATTPSDVVILTEQNFDAMTASGTWMLKFYAPWCGFCVQMAPTFEELATKLKGTVNIGKVDCTVHAALCKTFNVPGYPTLKLAVNGIYFDYQGDRSFDAMAHFAQGGFLEQSVVGYPKPQPIPPKQEQQQQPPATDYQHVGTVEMDNPVVMIRGLWKYQLAFVCRDWFNILSDVYYSDLEINDISTLEYLNRLLLDNEGDRPMRLLRFNSLRRLCFKDLDRYFSVEGTQVTFPSTIVTLLPSCPNLVDLSFCRSDKLFYLLLPYNNRMLRFNIETSSESTFDLSGCGHLVLQCPSLQSVHLRASGYCVNTSQFVDALVANPSVKSLSIDYTTGNIIVDTSIDKPLDKLKIVGGHLYLSRAIQVLKKSTNIRSLCLSLTLVDSDLHFEAFTLHRMAEFCKLIQVSKTLQSLTLSGDNRRDDLWQIFQAELPNILRGNHSLTKLHIQRARIVSTELLDLLAINTLIKDLELSQGALTEDHMEALSHMIQTNQSIVYLSLAANSLIDLCGHLSTALSTNRTIRGLNLSHNQLTLSSVPKALLTSDTLHKVDFSSSTWSTQAGLEQLSRYCNTSKSLISINLANCTYLADSHPIISKDKVEIRWDTPSIPSWDFRNFCPK